MRGVFRRWCAVSVLAVIAGCTMQRSAAGDRPRTDQAMILREQFQEHQFANAYEAVEALHSNWLSTRGTDSFSTPSMVRVYLDNTMLGGVESLRTVELTLVTYIKHLDGISATARWGLGHAAGVIFISTHPLSTDPPPLEATGNLRPHNRLVP
jgi:hypothetical protein